MFDNSEKPCKQKTYTATLLGEEDIPSFLVLQQKVWQELDDTKKYHLKLRDKKDLHDHIGYRMPVIGVKDENGTLVGQCLVTYPSNVDAVKNLDGYPIEGKETITAIVQSLAVDPATRGMGISILLLDAAKYVATMSGHIRLKAKVADDNPKSGKSFLNAGFVKASSGQDKNQNYPVTYLVWSSFYGCAAPLECVAK